MARANAVYYATRDPFADFTTSPEISQVFGEVLGLWAAVVWDQLGRPSPVIMAEAGPGRGTLMRDARRATARAAPDFHAAARVHLIETSPRLRAIQAAAVPDAVWHAGLDDLPPGPLILLANEFLDALPIRQFTRRGPDWTERFVTPLPGGGLVLAEQPCGPPAWDGIVEDGAIVEVNEVARGIIAALATRFAAHPGAALFLDYGPERSAPGDSLQAIAAGRPVDPLCPAGTADLTAHVDFAALAAEARAGGGVVRGPVPQGLFLAALGLFQRANRLSMRQPPERAAAIMAGARRLGEPDRMGRLFKALAVASPGIGDMPGFGG